MRGRSHYATPLLLAVFVGLILYVSLYPFRFEDGTPGALEVLRSLDWVRASRGDMFNNVLLYLPLGFCLALLVEPRAGRGAALAAGLAGGALLSLAMEVAQASIAIRVPSLTDLSLNAAGAFAGAVAGSAWHALGARMTPRAGPSGRSAALALVVVVLWLLARLWPLVPDAGLRQLKSAVRPLLSPQLAWGEVLAFFVGWLVVAQAVVHLVRRERSVDALLVVIAVVLVGRAFTAGAVLEAAELAALLLLLPALVLLSRLEDRTRSAVVALVLVAWLAGVALAPMLGGAPAAFGPLSLEEFLSRQAPAPRQLAGKAFNYVALAWLLASAGLYRHVAAGATVLLVLMLAMLHAGAAGPAYGWADLLIASVAAVAALRWLPRK
jgi:VanZ family protein